MNGIHKSDPILRQTRRASADLTELQLIGFDAAPAGLNSPVLGVAMTDAAAGKAVEVLMIGTQDMPSGGAISVGDEVSSDAQGRAVAGGAMPFGRALTATTGPDQRVEVLIR